MIRVAFFDLGGVVFLPNNDPVDEWEERLGLDPGAIGRALFGDNDDKPLIGAMTEDEWLDVVRGRLGWTSELLREFDADVLFRLRTDPDLVALIGSLRPGLKTAYLSNAWDKTRARLRERNLHRLVDEMFISAEMGVAKPDPKIYELACDAMGVPPHETLFVDDAESNIESAARFGMHAILHRSTTETVAAVRALLDG